MRRFLLLIAAGLQAGCSACTESSLSGDAFNDTAGHDPAVDVLIDDDVLTDSIHDTAFDPGEELPSLPYVPQCGNGVLDPGEECDDRNRLNGDGCDWLCRIGDGEPPPEPDPDVPDYILDGDPIPLEETASWGVDVERLPLVWTGSEFVTALYKLVGTEYSMDVRRFDRSGYAIDTDWTYPVRTHFAGLDLVWTGSDFGLFFSDFDSGIFYLRLDATGKPLGAPVLVVPDTAAIAPAADLADEGFALTWVREGAPGIGWSWCSWDGYYDSVWVRLVGHDGSTEGLPGPVLIEDRANGPSDIAAGEDGFGITISSDDTGAGGCANRFVGMNLDLSTVVYSGYLGLGSFGDVHWIEGHYYTAWRHWFPDGGEPVGTAMCVARFSAGGDLTFPPVCTNTSPLWIGVTRFAAGDRGLGIVTTGGSSEDDYNLWFMRTDMAGSSISSPQDIHPRSEPHLHIGPFAIVWADSCFGVLYDSPPSMWLQRFIVE